jgi:hypothetical protein
MTLLLSPYVLLAVLALIIIMLLLVSLRRPDGAPYLRLEAPGLLAHIVSPDSRKVGFGYQVFGWATYGLFFVRAVDGKPLIDTSTWLFCVAIGGTLIGGGTIADAWAARKMAEVAPAPAPAAPAAQ